MQSCSGTCPGVLGLSYATDSDSQLSNFIIYCTKLCDFFILFCV